MRDPDLYDGVAEPFDRYSERTTSPITLCLTEMTRMGRGDRVLDVACGSGLVAWRAAEAVGGEGHVLGVDISPGLLRVASRKPGSPAHARVAWGLMDALKLALRDDSFDVAVAQFPHLPDRDRCMSEMFRVLVPGGRFAICNGGGGAPPWPLRSAPAARRIPGPAIVDGLFLSRLAEISPRTVEATAGSAPGRTRPSPFARFLPRPLRNLLLSFGPSGATLRAELQRAGFTDIHLWSYEHIAPFESAEEVLELESVRTSVYRMRSELEEDRLRAFERSLLETLEAKLRRHGVLGLTTGALFATGIKPRR